MVEKLTADDIKEGMLIRVPAFSNGWCADPHSIILIAKLYKHGATATPLCDYSRITDILDEDATPGTWSSLPVATALPCFEVAERLNDKNGSIIFPGSKFLSMPFLRKHGYTKYLSSSYEVLRMWDLGIGYELLKPGLTMKNSDEICYGETGWKPVGFSCVITAVTWPIRRKSQEAVVQTAQQKEDEHARMCRFFFGRPPTDPSKLPPAPRALGMTWDELADW